MSCTSNTTSEKGNCSPSHPTSTTSTFAPLCLCPGLSASQGWREWPAAPASGLFVFEDEKVPGQGARGKEGHSGLYGRGGAFWNDEDVAGKVVLMLEKRKARLIRWSRKGVLPTGGPVV